MLLRFLQRIRLPIKGMVVLSRLGAAWLTDQRLKSVVQSAWCPSRAFSENILVTVAALSDWNTNVFGNIFHRKKIIIARLSGVQRKIAQNCHRGLLSLEKKLATEYQEILYQEELLWYQRSREDWIVSGDRNTKYYHVAATIRKSRNSFSSLRGEVGDWITDSDLLKAHNLPLIVGRLLWPVPFQFSRTPTGDLSILRLPKTRTARLSVNWNEECLRQFHPERGIRQGDPMSPAIFVLGLEKLCQMITHRVLSGDWKGIELAPGCPILSHLCFADDMVLFAEAFIAQFIQKFCDWHEYFRKGIKSFININESLNGLHDCYEDAGPAYKTIHKISLKSGSPS
nr:hypothetical protein TSUD_63510 [Ipomoea trifida]